MSLSAFTARLLTDGRAVAPDLQVGSLEQRRLWFLMGLTFLLFAVALSGILVHLLFRPDWVLERSAEAR